MTDELPPPPVPADCDLTGLAFMPLEVRRLTSSDFASQESPEACWAGVLLWCESWQQIPAASLTDNDAALARAAGYGRDVKAWGKVKAGALRGWKKCNDGRLYHPVVAEKALEAWLERLAQRKVGGEGNAKRWGMDFDRAKIEEAMELARQHLERLNPDSRALSKKRTARVRKDAPQDDDQHPDGIPPGSQSDGYGNPEGIPPGSQETVTVKGQGQGQGQGHRNNINRAPSSSPSSLPREDNPAAATAATPETISRKIDTVDAKAARDAILAGDLDRLVQAYGCDRGHSGEWRRDTHGMRLVGVAAILGWQVAQGKPIRKPSGFRPARAAWDKLPAEDRKRHASDEMDLIGVKLP